MQFFISVLYEIMSYSKMGTTSSCILVSLWLYLCTPFISVVMYKYGLQKKSEQPIACMDQLVIFLSQFLGRFINSVCKGNEGRTIQISVFFHVPKRKNKQNTEDRRQEPFSFRSLNKKSAELISNRLSCASYFYRVTLLLLLLPRSDPCTVATRYNSNSAGSWICRL